MKRWVFGIAVVFCMQVAFLAYQSAERSMMASYIAIEPVDHDGTRPLMADLPHERAENDPDLVGEPAARRIDIEPGQRKLPKVWRDSRRPPQNSLQVTETAPNDLVPVVVTYKRLPEFRFSTEPVSHGKVRQGEVNEIGPTVTKQPMVAKKQSPKRRSPIVRVVKKPYDWLKAFGKLFK